MRGELEMLGWVNVYSALNRSAGLHWCKIPGAARRTTVILKGDLIFVSQALKRGTF